MEWTSRAKYREYYCSACHGSLRRGARWHCARHREDFCEDCRPAPPGAAAMRGAGDIDVTTWKHEGPLPPMQGGHLLSEMIAEQERLIQEHGLGAREAREAGAAGEAGRRPGRAPAASAAAGARAPPAAGEAPG